MSIAAKPRKPCHSPSPQRRATRHATGDRRAAGCVGAASQRNGLTRFTTRGGGKDATDHAPGGHDDLANAACDALVNTCTHPALIISDEAMAWGGSFSQRGFGLVTRRQRLVASFRNVVTATAAYDAAIYGEFVADAMARGCQPGRLFTAAEIEAATETACTFHEKPRPASDIAEGVPATITHSAAVLGLAAFRAQVRRALCVALPTALIATQGAA